MMQGLQTAHARARRGARNHLAGMAAEEIVARHYQADGHEIHACRWRGQGGEIDLVAEDGEELVFIEVKAAASHEAAALRVTPRQQQRIMQAACEYIARLPRGLLTPMRVDVALVDGTGRVACLHNAIAA
ncbi:YraN family protein [Pseudoroseicyclus sp. H15]